VRSRAASAQMALQWDSYYRQVWDGVRLEGSYGMRASEALPPLEYAARKLGKQSGEDILNHRQLFLISTKGDSGCGIL
jgi:hypothetical protein